MNVLIIGCGKVGSRLAGLMSHLGHDVSIVDEDARHFEALPNDFTGIKVEGIAIDEDILRQAGIEGCDAIAAVTQDDNINVMVCQIASELFRVPIVLARVYDPIRESIFSQFNIRTICPTDLTVSSVYSILSGNEYTRQFPFGNSLINYIYNSPKAEYIGKTFAEFKQCEPLPNGTMFFGIMRENTLVALANDDTYILQAQDKVVYVEISVTSLD